MDADVLFVEELLRRIPELWPAYDEHLSNNDALLPHVFMGDVCRFATVNVDNPQARVALEALLSVMEDGLTTGGESVKGLIGGSFVENLIGEWAALRGMMPLMGPRLKAEAERMCS